MNYYSPADLRKRFSAHLIDIVIIFVPLLIIERAESTETSLNVFFFLFSLFAIFYSYARDGLLNGQSIGKKVMNLAVVDYNNQSKRIGINQSILRNLAFLLPFAYIIMLLQIEHHPSRRRLGDGLAKTMVVDLSKKTKGPFILRQEETFLGVKKRE